MAAYSPTEMHHRPRSTPSLTASAVSSRAPTPRPSPLLQSYPFDKLDSTLQQPPTICGLPLKYVSLVTLAVQNAALSIVMHYSRVSIPPALAYSPASAVLLNELLKGSISFVIALFRSPILNAPLYLPHRSNHHYHRRTNPLALYLTAFTDLCAEIFSPDCWKLSIPAILYVVQNSLQFVAISNLPVASFQVTYQMKILTTAAFSVALLRKKLTTVKWLSLFFLAIGVAIVQIQNSVGNSSPSSSASEAASNIIRTVVGKSSSDHGVGSAYEYHVHVMSPLKGFGAVTAACFTSGLAGVYFEMVLKGSKADLWVRNVQLSLFSLIPALLPILYATPPENSRGFILDLFRNFGWWAWATVAIQVFGGLVTAVVIKYSDNILKGFATSLSIVLSFLASVALFDFRITPSFIIGASTVLCATWMYNQPASNSNSNSSDSSRIPSPVILGKEPGLGLSIILNDPSPSSSGKSSPSFTPYLPETPVPINPDASASLLSLGAGSFVRRKSSGFGTNAGMSSPNILGGPNNNNAFQSSRNSSTASLNALISSVSNLGSTGGSGSTTSASACNGGARGELGLAESGELIHDLLDEGFLSGNNNHNPHSIYHHQGQAHSHLNLGQIQRQSNGTFASPSPLLAHSLSSPLPQPNSSNSSHQHPPAQIYSSTPPPLPSTFASKQRYASNPSYPYSASSYSSYTPSSSPTKSIPPSRIASRSGSPSPAFRGAGGSSS